MKFLIAAVAMAALIGGCNSGHDHSSHDHGTSSKPGMEAKVKDPVCGMMVDKSSVKEHHEDYKDGHYFFCSMECHDKFKAAPDKYAK